MPRAEGFASSSARGELDRLAGPRHSSHIQHTVKEEALVFRKRKSDAERRETFRKQIFHERQAGHYSERAGKAKTWEEREALMKQAQREIEKADYFEAERMD